MLLIALAHAHAVDVPHLHSSDAAAQWILGFWLAAGLAYLALAHASVRPLAR